MKNLSLPFQHRTQYVQTALYGVHTLDNHAATTTLFAQDAGTEMLGGVLDDAVEGGAAVEGVVCMPYEV